MKRIYILRREGREAAKELIDCAEYLKSQGIECFALIGDLGYGSFWVENANEWRALEVASKGGFNVVSSIRDEK
jgi:hypothetical protein